MGNSNMEISLKMVAAITAALSASGLLAPGDRITDIKRTNKQNSWKRSGMIKIMLDRDFALPRL